MINFSTSSQVCFIIERDKYDQLKSSLPKSITIFPFFENKVLLVAASLNGGNVLDNFVDMIIKWNNDLGYTNDLNESSTNDLWSKLIDLGSRCVDDGNEKLECKPKLFAERHDKMTFASIQNIRQSNNSIGQVFNSICKGLIQNLNEMFPKDLLIRLGCKRILATGSALIRNSLLKKHFESEFNGINLEYKSSSDSALGAALVLRKIFL